MKNKQVSLIFTVPDNEVTEAPYWLIIDPRQMMKPDVHVLAGMITGPFFSRAEAQLHLQNRRYAFSERAAVFCMSGYWSQRYKEAWRSAETLGF